jgi:hypothetical protein
MGIKASAASAYILDIYMPIYIYEVVAEYEPPAPPYA